MLMWIWQNQTVWLEGSLASLLPGVGSILPGASFADGQPARSTVDLVAVTVSTFSCQIEVCLLVSASRLPWAQKWSKGPLSIWKLSSLPVGCCYKNSGLPWLVWLSGLSTGLRTGRSLVWFPVGAYAWVAGQIPNQGHVRGNRSVYLLHIDGSLPLFLPPFPSL